MHILTRTVHATLASLVLLGPGAAAAQEPGDGDQRVSRTFDVGSEPSLELSNIAGSITLSAVDGSTISITATKRVRPRSGQSLQEALDDIEVEFDRRGDRIEVRTRYNRDSRRGSRASVSYDVRVPARTRVTVNSVSGDIDCTDVAGELSAHTVSGTLRIRSADRLGHARTVSGDLRIESARSTGLATIGTVSGDLRAEQLVVERLEVESVSGDIELRDVTATRVDVSTVSGDVDYEGPLAEDGSYELNTHSGDVTLRLVGGTGFELSAETFSGDLETDVPLTLRGGSRLGSGDRGRGRRQRSLQGTYGDGGARVDVNTFSGDLDVRRR